MRRAGHVPGRTLAGMPLPWWIKLHIYGLHGLFIEVIFTAGWEYVVNKNWKLPGCSSVWSLAIYGISGLVMEYMHICMKRRAPLLLRGLAYLLWVYMWEYTTGSLLSMFHACPWNYSQFDYNVHGLITFEYAPLWYIVSLVMEKCVITQLPSLIKVDEKTKH
ncbi:transmembrane protein 229B [Anabrus simplex]|uniref:transmembrane protein 229B n=1 Tax=Anabrus simplex TaxID=316456 RepID=UPI0035A36A04